MLYCLCVSMLNTRHWYGGQRWGILLDIACTLTADGKSPLNLTSLYLIVMKVAEMAFYQLQQYSASIYTTTGHINLIDKVVENILEGCTISPTSTVGDIMVYNLKPVIGTGTIIYSKMKKPTMVNFTRKIVFWISN